MVSKFERDDSTAKTVLLTLTTPNDIYYGTGAIVYCGMGLILMISCGHNVTECVDPKTQANSKLEVSFFDDLFKKTYRATIISDMSMAEEEFSMFYVVDYTERKSFQFCQSETIASLKKVAAPSFATGRQNISFATGVISNTGEGVFYKRRGRKLSHTVSTEKGSSGCPIVDVHGKLVAIHTSATKRPCSSSPANPGQIYYQTGQFKFGLHIESVEEFIREIVGGLEMKFESMGRDIDELMYMICLKYSPDPEVRNFISRFHPTPNFKYESIPEHIVNHERRVLETLVTENVETFKDAVRGRKKTFLSQLESNDPLIGETIEILKQMYGDEGVSVTALTPKAASDLKDYDCQLLESFVGIDLALALEVNDDKVSEMLSKMNMRALKKWRKTKALVIYGINQINRRLICTIDFVAQHVMSPVNYDQHYRWGAIQLVVISDSWEIPPPQPYAKEVCLFYNEDDGKVMVTEGYYPWRFKIRLTMDQGICEPDGNLTWLYEIYRTWKLTLLKCEIDVVLVQPISEMVQHNAETVQPNTEMVLPNTELYPEQDSLDLSFYQIPFASIISTYFNRLGFDYLV